MARCRLAALLVLASLVALGASLRCVQCGRQIRGKYLTSLGKPYCSQACYEKTLPVCAVCGRRCTGRFVRSDGKTFCSQRCFRTTLPVCEICGVRVRKAIVLDGTHVFCERCAALPDCSRCQLPCAKGTKFLDGRRLCENCQKDAVLDPAQARELYRRARSEVAAATGMRSDSMPPLELVGLDRITEELDVELSADDRMVRRGLYQRTETTTTAKNIFGLVLKRDTAVTERVLMLYGLSREAFLATASHELMHDLLAENVPAVGEAPLWVEEGVCQYAAALVCRRMRLKHVLEDIQTCPDRCYGDGYRYVKRLAGPHNWPRVRAWLRETDLAKLPRHPPATD